MENTNNQIKIPYLSAAKMGRLMELVSQRSLASVTPDYFKNYGFGQADAYLAINTLRFLKIIDEYGKSTDNLRKFQLRGDTRNNEVQEILKDAYNKLFSVKNDPFNLSKEDLTNEFMHHYSISRRIAISAVPAFLKLCEFAGLVEQGSVLTIKRATDKFDKKQSKTGIKVNPKSRVVAIKNENNGYTIIPIANGKMEWHLPTEILTKMAFGGEIAEDIKTITTQLSQFAEKHCSNGDEPFDNKTEEN